MRLVCSSNEDISFFWAIFVWVDDEQTGLRIVVGFGSFVFGDTSFACCATLNFILMYRERTQERPCLISFWTAVIMSVMLEERFVPDCCHHGLACYAGDVPSRNCLLGRNEQRVSIWF